MKLLHNLVLVKAEVVEQATTTGIILAGEAVKQTKGIIVATGPGKWEHGIWVPNVCNPGELVMFNVHAPLEVEYQGEKHLLMKDVDIFMKFDKETGE